MFSVLVLLAVILWINQQTDIIENVSKINCSKAEVEPDVAVHTKIVPHSEKHIY